MTPTIRAATAADVPALVALMTDFYSEAGFALPSAPAERAFRALLADPGFGAVWLAEDGLAAVGHVVLTVSFSMEYGGLRGSIDDLYVRPQARGRGIAATLLTTVRAACVQRGVRALHVEVDPENAAVRRLYGQAGYVGSGHLLLTLPLAAPVHVTDSLST